MRHGVGEGTSPGRFGRQNTGDLARYSDALHLSKPFCDAKEKLAVADGEHHRAGDLAAELSVEFVRDGLVTFRAKRIAGMKAGQVARRHETGLVDDLPQRR